MKKMIIPSNLDEIKSSMDYVDAYLIGINNMCISNGLNINIEDLNEIINITKGKEIFININKNMENKDIDNLRNILLELNNYSIKGIFYYDVAVLNIYNECEFHYDLVWASEHATTNYDTINFWYSFGVSYTQLSSDITLNEVYDIRKNTDCKLIVPIFGYQQMFASKRHIVNNYLKQFNIVDNSKINYMEKEDKIYPIIDNNLGTVVYSNYILNGINEYFNLLDKDIDYLLFDSFNISDNDFIEVLKIVNNLSRDNIKDSYEHINSLFKNTDSGFLYKETIARVKKNEK